MVTPRLAVRPVGFVDEYCEAHRSLFEDVRSYECFKYLHVGLMSDLKWKKSACHSLFSGSARQSTPASLCQHGAVDD